MDVCAALPYLQELYFTDNGRDDMGPNRPDCELNKVTQDGQDFGSPYCHVSGQGWHSCNSSYNSSYNATQGACRHNQLAGTGDAMRLPRLRMRACDLQRRALAPAQHAASVDWQHDAAWQFCCACC